MKKLIMTIEINEENKLEIETNTENLSDLEVLGLINIITNHIETE